MNNKNSKLGAAATAYETASLGAIVYQDGAAGKLWLTTPEVLSLGRWNRQAGWVWHADNIAKSGLDANALAVETSS
jgi:hypothetical protein